MLDNRKILKFVGMGWEDADTSINSGVGNCRIRTQLRNKEGRVIFLEFTGREKNKSDEKIDRYKDIEKFIGFTTFAFYVDSSWDKRRNYSRGLKSTSNKAFEYSNEGILNFVNENYNCDFEKLEVINDNSIPLESNDPLCDCSIEGYIPFIEPTYNINELKNVESVKFYRNVDGFKEYKINTSDILPLLPWVYERYDDKEIQNKIKENSFVSIRYDKAGVIYSCDISCGFGCIGMGVEDLGCIITVIKDYNLLQMIS